MFRNTIRVTVRNLIRHKAYAAINICGLAIGIACCVVIFLYVQSEAGYDAYHAKGKNLYRLTLDIERMGTGDIWTSATSSILWAPALKKDYPEIDATTRVMQEDPRIFRAQGHEFTETRVVFADRQAFDLFTWPLVSGDFATALAEPYTMVINSSTARKYFGNENPLGQVLLTDVESRNENGEVAITEIQVKITGVMEDIPYKSHLKPDIIVSFITLNDIFGGDVTGGSHQYDWFWRGRLVHNYLLLGEGVAPSQLEDKFQDFLDRYVGDATVSRGYRYLPYLQSVAGIHLEGNVVGTFEASGDRNQITLFSVIAIFVLSIACINFMNLSTARSATRAREVGIRKVVGANRKALIRQFLGESIVMSCLAMVLAMILTQLINPIFYTYINRELYIGPGDLPMIILGIFLIMAFVGLISGSYPAFFLSRFLPIQALRKSRGARSKGVTLRKALVVTQFAITVFFIFGATTVYNQLKFMRNQDLGFDSNQVLALPPEVTGPVLGQMESYRQELVGYPEIRQASFSSTLPGSPTGGDIWGVTGKSGEEGVSLNEFAVDYDFVDLYGLELVAGRQFSREMGSDAAPANPEAPGYEMAGILNEAAVRRYGWSSAEEALGQRVVRDPVSNDFTCSVIGVVKDFHFASLRNEIQPAILFINPNYNSDYRFLSLNISASGIPATLDFIRQRFQPLLDEANFSYFFVDDHFAQLYADDERMVEIFGYISALTIIVACLGLLGLASFASEQRTKEIGIRKVLGGTVSGLVGLLSMEFVKLVLLATLIACPVAYWVMNGWLEEFAYRFEIGVGTFVLSAALAVVIAMVTVSSQAFRAALTNPADSLRYE